MDLSVVIPTRDRRRVLIETLARLEAQSGDVRFEVIVVDDGSTDGTGMAVMAFAQRRPLEIQLIAQRGLGPAAARNRALRATRAPVCLFLNDDTFPHRDLVARHRDFHLRNPEPEAALLGRVTLSSDPAPTPFMRWLSDLQFDYRGIGDSRSAGGERFYTANVSAKMKLLRRAGGFDERFAMAAHEDIDLGLRLQRHGMRLSYDADAVVEHCHPTDLATAIDRLRAAGRGLAPFVERHPDWPVPRRPGVRHRVKAGALTGLAAIGLGTPRLQRETWRFLCHQASREGYWSAVDGRRCSGDRLRIGSRLAGLASRDDDARMPAGYLGRPDA